jgi:hypothetical protein
MPPEQMKQGRLQAALEPAVPVVASVKQISQRPSSGTPSRPRQHLPYGFQRGQSAAKGVVQGETGPPG